MLILEKGIVNLRQELDKIYRITASDFAPDHRIKGFKIHYDALIKLTENRILCLTKLQEDGDTSVANQKTGLEHSLNDIKSYGEKLLLSTKKTSQTKLQQDVEEHQSNAENLHNTLHQLQRLIIETGAERGYSSFNRVVIVHQSLAELERAIVNQRPAEAEKWATMIDNEIDNMITAFEKSYTPSANSEDRKRYIEALEESNRRLREQTAKLVDAASTKKAKKRERI